MLCFTGLTRVKDAVVGDAELREVSGGQTRRVGEGFYDLTLFPYSHAHSFAPHLLSRFRISHFPFSR